MSLNPVTGIIEPDFPTCRQCKFGVITLNGQDRCTSPNNVGLHPVALRVDALKCGPVAAWRVAPDTPDEGP